MTGIAWTDEQRDGVRSVGQSLVVSAAAGSGKTAVLAGRCVELIARGGVDSRRDPPVAAEPCDVDALLVVTFTNLAARQMRERIAARLAEAVEAASAEDRPRLQRQLLLLPTAEINTLSSFCARLVRRHFNAAGVDPAFAVLDDDQARLLRREAARDAIEAALADDADGGFVALLDDHFDGNDASVLPALLDIHQVRNSLIDPDGWEAEFLEGLETFAAGGDLDATAIGKAARAAADAEVTAILAASQALRDELSKTADAKLTKLANYAEGWADRADAVAEAIATGRLADASDVLAEPPGRASPIRGEVAGKEELSAAMKHLRDRLKPDGPLGSLLAFGDEKQRLAAGSTFAPTRRLLALSRDFEKRYAERKETLRALDFANLDRLALRLLDADPTAEEPQPTAIARRYRDRFAHVLVDEVQDINALQDRLLRLLSRGGDAEDAGPPNLFCVGDVKQSIYRFRLAEPRLFLDRLRDADGEHARRIDLQRNFRSRTALLEAINGIFLNLLVGGGTEIDYADRHALRPDPSYPPVPDGGFAGAPIEVHVLDAAAEAEEADDDGEDLDRIEHEAVFVARQLHDWRQAKRTVIGQNGEAEPLEFEHVAVLMRSQKFNSERFAASLRREGVPCHAEVGTGFFAASEVRDVVTLLRAIDNRRQDVPMAALLRSPISNPPPGLELGDLLGRVRSAKGADAGTFYDAAVAFSLGDDDAATFVAQVLARLDRWRDAAGRLPVAEMLRRLLDDTGYAVYVSGVEDAAQRRANLDSLLARAERFDRQRRDGLGAFLDYLGDLEQHAEIGQPPALGAGDNAVRVMSVHAAKGLEFPIVFLVDCGKTHNMKSASGRIVVDRDFGVALEAVDGEKLIRYDSPQQTLARRHIREATAAEELRILYVAMTRAKEALICVGHGEAKDIDAWQAGNAGRPAAAEVTAGGSFLHWLCTAGAPPHVQIETHAAANLTPAARATADSVPLAVRRREATTLAAQGTAADALRDRLRPYAHLDTADAAAAASFDQSAPAAPLAALAAGVEKVRSEWSWWQSTQPGQEVAAAAERWLDVPLHVPGDGGGNGLDAPMVRGRVLALWRASVDGTLCMVDDADEAAVLAKAAAVSHVVGEPVARLWRVDATNETAVEMAPLAASASGSID